METAADFLVTLADLLDQWAKESRTGGWSTHQADANQRAAEAKRRGKPELYKTAYDRAVSSCS